MGYNARNDEIRDNVTRMRREWEAQRGSLATDCPLRLALIVGPARTEGVRGERAFRGKSEHTRQ
jgi:hypothetical protein